MIVRSGLMKSKLQRVGTDGGVLNLICTSVASMIRIRSKRTQEVCLARHAGTRLIDRGMISCHERQRKRTIAVMEDIEPFGIYITPPRES